MCNVEQMSLLSQLLRCLRMAVEYFRNSNCVPNEWLTVARKTRTKATDNRFVKEFTRLATRSLGKIAARRTLGQTEGG